MKQNKESIISYELQYSKLTKKKIIQYLTLFVMFLILLYYLSANLVVAINNKEQYNSESIRFEGNGITQKKIEDSLNMERDKKTKTIPQITAYNRIDSEKIENDKLVRNMDLSVMIVSGDMSVTTPMDLLAGNYVYKEDTYGCLIDSKSAYQLFGTINAVGSIVTYHKQQYYIRGVVSTDSPVFFIQSNKEDMEYKNLEIVYPGQRNAEELVEQFLTSNQYPSHTLIDGVFYGGMIHSLLLLPIWLFYMIVTIKIGLYYKSKISNEVVNSRLYKSDNTKDYKKGNLIGIILIAILYISMIILCGYSIHKLTGNPFRFMMKYIPTKWSDFDFWPEHYKLITDQLNLIKYRMPNPKDDRLVELLTLGLHRFAIINLFYIIILIYSQLLKHARIKRQES
ncbi:ABC transporter permease [Anaeromicropila herbilytica]|nr:ABC transporter permease [Anaeromicropila herbilytica]